MRSSHSLYDTLRRNGITCGELGASIESTFPRGERGQQIEEWGDIVPTSPFASVEHRLTYQCYPSDSTTARSLLWEGALGNWPGDVRVLDASLYSDQPPYSLADAHDAVTLRTKIMALKDRWNTDANLVGALALLLAGSSRSAKETRRRHGLDGRCRPLPSTYVDAWEHLALSLKRKYALPDLPFFREVLLSGAQSGKLPLLVEMDTNAQERPSFWAGIVHERTLYGENAGGVLLSRVRASLLWDAVRSKCGSELSNCDDQELLQRARDAEDLYLAGLGYVRGEACASTYGKLSDLCSPMPDMAVLDSLGFKAACSYKEVRKGLLARDLAPIELAHPLVYFRSKAKMPWALLSNFAYVPWGA